MTARKDPQGRATTFTYNTSGSTARLTTVTAADGTAFTVSDDGAGLISGVACSATGQSVSFDRSGDPDGTGMTGITDAVGITTSFAGYFGDTNSLPEIRTIQSPYGTTTIDAMTHELVTQRELRITHPNDDKEMFVLVSTLSSMPTAFVTAQIPTNTPLGTLDTTGRNERNIFHWGPQACAGGFVYVAGLDTNTINQARIEHWLATGDYNYTHFDTLSLVQLPSPLADGSVEGAILWYDYVGKAVSYEKGTQVQPSVIARVMPDGSTAVEHLTRNSQGKVLTRTNAWMEWSGSAWVLKTRGWSNVYSGDGLDLLRSFGPDGNLIAGYAYGSPSLHVPTAVTNVLGEVTTYTYDGSVRPSTELTPAGLLRTYNYGTDGRIKSLVETTNSVTVRSLGYSWSNGYPLTRTNELGLVTSYVYDSLGRLLREQYPDGTGITNLYTITTDITGTYPEALPPATAIIEKCGTYDRLGNFTEFIYDNRRRLVMTIDPNGHQTAYAYCACGSPSSITRGADDSVRAETTTFDYDYQGRRLTTTTPDGNVVTNLYDAWGQVVSVQNALGGTTNVFDNLGRLTQVKNAFGTVETRTYDVEDRLTLLTDRNGVTTTNTYDNLGRIKTRALAGGQAEQWFYTANFGGPTSYTNQIGKETQWTYDPTQRKTKEITVGVMTNSFTYDAAGNLLTLTDGNSQVTTWGFDAYGRVLTKKYANGQTNLIYAYDASSRLTNRWSQAKGNTAYGYDRSGNLTNVNYPSSTDLKFQFDALNRTTNMIDAVGTTKYGYTNGLLAFEDGPWASDTITNSYNGARLRSQMVILQPTGNAWTNTYGYDSARRLSSVVSPAGTFSYQFSGPGSLVTKLTQPDGFWITNTFDSRARMTDTTLYDNTTTILNRHGYTLNHAHQRTMISRTNYAQTGWNTYVDYTYDNAGEIRTAKTWRTGTNLLAWNFDYGYDAGWNILKRTNNAAVTSYSVNNLNQITSDGGASYTHDANGNLTYRPDSNNLNYTYDDENQLASVAAGTFYKLEFTYDGRGRLRVEKTYSWSGSAWVYSSEKRFLYDGMVQVQQRSSSNHPTVTYTRGTDLSGSLDGAGGIGGLLSRGAHAGSPNYQLSSSAHYHADGNGNVTMLVGSGSPSIKAYYHYDPFGRTLASGGTLATANVMRFSSKPVVGDYSTLYYYGYRFYEPAIQRWLNRDPKGEDGGINVNAMSVNDAINHFDALGLEIDWGGTLVNERSKGNCWRHACNDPQNPQNPRETHAPEPPGWDRNLPPGKDPEGIKSCADLLKGLGVSGAAVPLTAGGCPAGYNKTSVQYSDNVPFRRDKTRDFHFAREKDDGSGGWCDKIGPNPVRNYDKQPAPPTGYVECGMVCLKNGWDTDK